MPENETTKCAVCDFDNDPTAKICASTPCGSYLKSDLEALRSIDLALSNALVKFSNEAAEVKASLKTIKRVAIWFLILSILGLLMGISAAMGAFR